MAKAMGEPGRWKGIAMVMDQNFNNVPCKKRHKKTIDKFPNKL